MRRSRFASVDALYFTPAIHGLTQDVCVSMLHASMHLMHPSHYYLNASIAVYLPNPAHHSRAHYLLNR